MQQLSKKTIFFGFIKWALFPWAILFLGRYLYHYGFNLVSLSITTDVFFISDSIAQFVIMCGIYASSFAEPTKGKS
jgi:hypothetical protein